MGARSWWTCPTSSPPPGLATSASALLPGKTQSRRRLHGGHPWMRCHHHVWGVIGVEGLGGGRASIRGGWRLGFGQRCASAALHAHALQNPLSAHSVWPNRGPPFRLGSPPFTTHGSPSDAHSPFAFSPFPSDILSCQAHRQKPSPFSLIS